MFVNNLIKVIVTLSGAGCFAAAYFLHQSKTDDWGWFLFVGLIVLGEMINYIAEEKK